MIEINALLDFILFLYSHIKSSKNDNSIINKSDVPQIIIDNFSAWIIAKVFFENLKNLGKEKCVSVRKVKTK